MKIKHLALLFLGMIVFQSQASAESVSGTVTGVDPGNQKLTVRRTGSTEDVTVFVRDNRDFNTLRTGENFDFDLSRRTDGQWEAKSYAGATRTLPTSTASTSAGVSSSGPSTTTATGASTSVASNGLKSTLKTDLSSNNSSTNTSSKTSSNY